VATKKAAKNTAIVRWDEKFAQYAKQSTDQVANVGGGGTSIKFGRGKIEVGGVPVPNGRLECVVLGSCALNAWYGAKYDPSDVQPPDCYAFADEYGDKDMKPHEAVTDPQADTCAECEKNEFGTADNGKGKACGNNIRLGLLTAKDVEDADDAGSAELASAKVSPTNAKHYAAYVKLVAEDYGRPPWAVVTEISSHDDPKTQIRLEFKFVSLIEDDDILSKLETRFLKIQNLLQVPFAPKTERPARPVKSVAKSSKFAGKGKR
jgi:hypothetical protein